MNEREEKIWAKVINHASLATERYGERAWVTMLYGSQNYELDTEESDVDVKTMIFPTIEDVILGRKMVSTDVAAPDGSLNNVKDYRGMFQNYLKGNINFVETLYTNFYCVNTHYRDYFDELRANRDLIANARPQKLVHMAAGMAMQKYEAFERPFESKKEILAKYGYDPKQLHHLARLTFFISQYLQTMDFGLCLRPGAYDAGQREYLLNIKLDPPPYEKAKEMKETYMKAVNCLAKVADERLPSDNGFGKAEEFLNDLTVRIFKERINKK